MIVSTYPVTHPSIPSATWTKVSVIPAGSTMPRKLLVLMNEDGTNTFRFEFVQAGGSVPTLATQGLPLYSHGEVTYDHTACPTGDVYVYQASGGALTSLGVMEGI